MDIVFRSGEARPVILNTLLSPLLGFFSCVMRVVEKPWYSVTKCYAAD